MPVLGRCADCGLKITGAGFHPPRDTEAHWEPLPRWRRLILAVTRGYFGARNA